MIEKRKMTKFQLKNAFEYFNDLYNKPGKRPAYSAFVFDNYNRLMPHYVAIQNSCYDERRDPQFPEYNSKLHDLRLKFALTDEKTGRPILNEAKDLQLDNNKVEDFKIELNALNEEYKDLVERLSNKQKTNSEIFNQMIEIEVVTLGITSFIDDAPPFIVGIFRTGAI